MLDAVTEARARAISRAPPLTALRPRPSWAPRSAGLLAITEAYPDLKADANFRQLATELSDTEQRLAFARDFASHRVATYHQQLDTFPSVLLARAFSFERAEFFAVADAAARRVPEVDLGEAQPVDLEEAQPVDLGDARPDDLGGPAS